MNLCLASENRFTTNPRRSARNAQQQSSAVDETQNGQQNAQANGHAADEHGTNGLSATNGNAHTDRLSATNGATPPTSTNIIAEMNDDEYSYTSDFSSSGDSDWDMQDTVETEKSKDDEFGFADDQFSIILSMGKEIAAFAKTIQDPPPELIRRMEVKLKNIINMTAFDKFLNLLKLV